MAENRVCTECGGETFDDGSGADLCPACVLRLALDPEPEVETARGPRQDTPGEAPEDLPSVGPYKSRAVLGEGGMGVVYLAEQREPIRRTVALKLIKLGMDSREIIQRFESERQALARMDHPNIARVFDAGTSDQGRPYFVMEYVPGLPITEYCDQRRLNTRARVELFIQVCDAVQHAHQKGIIHRDIKPSNLLVAEQEGRALPKVIDFGVAKATERPLTAAVTFTKLGQLIGTPQYMSPEQAQLTGVSVDTRTDVYSLGVVLFELLAGALPFEQEELEGSGFDGLLKAIREQESSRPSTRARILGGESNVAADNRRTDPRTLVRQLRGDLDWIVMRALEKDRARRYGMASELAADLRRYLNCEPVLAGPPGVRYRLQKFLRRYRVAVFAGTAVVLSLVIGFAATTALYVKARAAGLEAEQARSAEVKQREEADRRGYVANIIAADASLRVREIAEAKRRLAGCEPGLRGWEWGHLRLRVDQSLATLTGHTDRVAVVDVGPDGERIASASRDGTVRIWDVSSGKTVATLRGHEDWVYGVAFGPAGRRVVSGSRDRTVRIWDARSGTSLAVLTGHEDGVQTVDFGPDGRRVVSGSRDQTVRVWDASSGEMLAKMVGHDDWIRSVVFSPDGKRVVSGSSDKTVRVWDAARGTPLAVLAGHEGRVQSVAIDPGGRRIASGANDQTVRVWDAESGRQLAVWQAHDDFVGSVAFSPDGQRIVSGSGDKTVKVWASATGAPLATLVGHDSWSSSAVFATDGRHIISGSRDRTIRIWEARGGAAVTVLSAHGDAVNTIAFVPDGRRVVSGSSDGTATVWDVATGESLTVFTGHRDAIRSVDVSPDGTRVASGSRDGTVRIWDTLTGSELLTQAADGEEILAVAFDREGKLVASGSESGALRVWNLVSGRTRKLSGHGDRVHGVAFRPDGRQIASASGDGTVRLWDTVTGEAISVLHSGPTVVYSVDFDSAGTRIASASADGTVRVWDAGSGKSLATLVGHDQRVYGAAFNSDGTRIASSDDRAVRLLDASTGDLLLALRGHESLVNAVAFSPDSSTIASASADGTVRIWRSRLDSLPGDPAGPSGR